MLLLMYRTLPQDNWLPVDQRWRVIEVDPEPQAGDGQGFGGLDLTSTQGVMAAIRRINDGKVNHVDPIPHGAEVKFIDTDDAEMTLNLTLSIESV